MSENSVIIIKMIRKIYYKEPQGSFKVYIEKQDTYWLECRKRTDNKLITPKQVANKLISQRLVCVDCGSKKSVFVKQDKPNKNQK